VISHLFLSFLSLPQSWRVSMNTGICLALKHH
jgi:hypothetical protein